MHSTSSQPSPNPRRPGPWRAIFPIGLTLLLTSGCATTGFGPGSFNLVSIDDEWKMGNQLEQEVSKKLRIVNDPSAQAYVNRIGQRIVAQSELANRPWKFHIVADPEINAFNIPGGHVYVNTGLILAAGNASELAGVMAHEISHGVARHATEQMSAAYGINTVGNILLGQNPSTVKQIAAQLAATGVLAKYSRSAESEADELGVQAMYRAGYNPNGMATMFEKLLATRKRRPGSVEQFFATHPLAEDRITSVRREIAALPPRAGLIGSDGSLASIQQRVKRVSG
jgi:predicted Zn-dependent protease